MEAEQLRADAAQLASFGYRQQLTRALGLWSNFSLGEVTSQYPIAGGIYQWCKQLLGDRYAWFAGWFYIWALLVTIAAVAFGSAPYVGALFGFTVTSGNTKVVAILMITLAAVINLTGVRNLARIALFGVVAEVLGTFVFGIIFLAKEHHHGFGAIFHTSGAGSGGYLGAFLAAALFSVWIF